MPWHSRLLLFLLCRSTCNLKTVLLFSSDDRSSSGKAMVLTVCGIPLLTMIMSNSVSWMSRIMAVSCSIDLARNSGFIPRKVGFRPACCSDFTTVSTVVVGNATTNTRDRSSEPGISCHVKYSCSRGIGNSLLASRFTASSSISVGNGGRVMGRDMQWSPLKPT